jgi:hypothetical protein
LTLDTLDIPQFPDLSRIFEVRRLQVLAQDRSTFDDLVTFVLAYINDWQTRSGGRNGKVMMCYVCDDVTCV